MTRKKFPAGELLIRAEDMVHFWDLRTSDDILALLMAADANQRAGKPAPSIAISYFAYGRQDRVCNQGEAFSLKVVCDLINSAGFTSVTVLEPHSLVLPALLDNCHIMPMTGFVAELAADKVVIAPDAGAEKRAYEVAKAAGSDMVVALKKRNPLNGEIISIDLFCDDLQGKDCLIVDDICDGGATFLHLAVKLREKNCGKITLAIAHGIFTRGAEVFNGKIDEVYCIENYKLTKKELNYAA
jgi:ribose-phosphate pyrophosphokinase